MTAFCLTDTVPCVRIVLQWKSTCEKVNGMVECCRVFLNVKDKCLACKNIVSEQNWEEEREISTTPMRMSPFYDKSQLCNAWPSIKRQKWHLDRDHADNAHEKDSSHHNIQS